MNMNILFVCLGNICRSPMAAGIMRNYFIANDIDGLVDSAGTENWNVGRPADSRAVRIAMARGADISKHRARQITAGDFDRFDALIAMDRANLKSLRASAPKLHHAKISLVAEDEDVVDPYYSDESMFELTYSILDRHCESLAKRISAQASRDRR